MCFYVNITFLEFRKLKTGWVLIRHILVITVLHMGMTRVALMEEFDANFNHLNRCALLNSLNVY